MIAPAVTTDPGNAVGVRQLAGAADRAASASTNIVQLCVPAPPSVNEMFKNARRGRCKTRVYNDWAGHAGWVVRDKLEIPKTWLPRSKLSNSQRRHYDTVVPGRVLILVSVERMNALADIDNRIKAIFDLLVEERVIQDDSNVVGFAAAWAPPGSKLARVAIMPAADIVLNFSLAADGAHGGWYLNAPNPEEGPA